MNMEDNDIKKKKINKTIIIIIIAIVSIPILIGIYFLLNALVFKTYFGSIHSKEEFINFIDNSTITVNDKTIPTNLKGNYTIVNEEVSNDSDGHKYKKVIIKINNSDLKLNVYSGYSCLWHISLEGKNCRSYKYKLYFGHFNKEVMDYYFDDYNSANSYKIDSNHIFYVNTKDDLTNAVDYINGFFNYINSYDFRFIDTNEIIKLYIKSDSDIKILIDYDVDNNNFKPRISSINYAKDDSARIRNNIEIDDLKTYIDNFLNEEGFTLN